MISLANIVLWTITLVATVSWVYMTLGSLYKGEYDITIVLVVFGLIVAAIVSLPSA